MKVKLVFLFVLLTIVFYSDNRSKADIAVRLGAERGGRFYYHDYNKDFFDIMERFFNAVQSGSIDDIRKIHQEYQDLQQHDRNLVWDLVNCSGVLHQAAISGDRGIFRQLIAWGDAAEYMPKYAAKTSPFHLAAKHGHLGLVQDIIALGVPAAPLDEDGKTPAHYAAAAGHLEVVDFLLKKGADPLVEDDYGVTLLHEAASSGNEKLVRLLLEKGAPVEARDLHGNTPLLYGAAGGSVAVVKTLLAAGADLDGRNDWGRIGEGALHFAAEKGQTEVVRHLLAAGLSPDSQGRKGRTPLMLAAEGGFDETVGLLLEHGAKPQCRDDWDSTAMHYAARSGSVPVYELLRAAGSDVQTENYTEGSPLHIACAAGRADLAWKMLDDGATIDRANYYGETTLELAIRSRDWTLVSGLLERSADPGALDPHSPWMKQTMYLAVEEKNPPLVRFLADLGVEAAFEYRSVRHRQRISLFEAAARSKNEEIVAIIIEHTIRQKPHYLMGYLWIASKEGLVGAVKLLQQHGTDFNAADLVMRRPPLLQMARYGHLPVVEYLVENGADVNATDKYGNTALMEASDNGQLDVVHYLLDRGADINPSGPKRSPLQRALVGNERETAELLITRGADVTRPDENGHTPLHIAAAHGYHEIAESLIARGADYRAVDKDGKSPLQFAAEYGHEDLVDYFIELGADPLAYDDWHCNVLHWAAAWGIESLIGRLVKMGADLNAVDKDGFTPLDYALQRDQVGSIRTLLRLGADGRDAKVHLTSFSLMKAAANGNTNLLKKMAKLGFDLDSSQDRYLTLRQIAALGNDINAPSRSFQPQINHPPFDNFERNTPLYWAVVNSQTATVRHLLDAGVDAGKVFREKNLISMALFAQDNEIVLLLIERAGLFDTVILYQALAAENLQVARVLLKKGVAYQELPRAETGIYFSPVIETRGLHSSPVKTETLTRLVIAGGATVRGVKTYNQNSVLHRAAMLKNVNLGELYLEKGADPNDLNVEGDSPLHLAARYGDHELVRLLLKHGADPTVKNHFGQTPLHLAAQEGYPVVARLLAEKSTEAIRDEQGFTAAEVAAGQGFFHLAGLLGGVAQVGIEAPACGGEQYCEQTNHFGLFPQNCMEIRRHPNGRKMSEKRIVRGSYTEIEWHPNGRKQSERHVSGDYPARHSYQEWNQEGEKTVDRTWSDDQQQAADIWVEDQPRQGPFESRHKNGRLKVKGQFENNFPDGWFEYWSEDGALSSKVLFRAPPDARTRDLCSQEWVEIVEAVEYRDGRPADATRKYRELEYDQEAFYVGLGVSEAEDLYFKVSQTTAPDGKGHYTDKLNNLIQFRECINKVPDVVIEFTKGDAAGFAFTVRHVQGSKTFTFTDKGDPARPPESPLNRY